MEYETNFGLGYEIERPVDGNDETTHRYTIDGYMRNMCDFSEYVRKSSHYFLKQGGSIYKREIKWYIFIKYPFDYGYDLTNEVKKLTEYCRNMRFKIIGRFGLYGGLYIN